MKLHQKLYQYSFFHWNRVACRFQKKSKKFGRKPENIQWIASEAWILIKLQCVIYQWIRLDKLYKQMKSFSKIRILFLN